MGTGEETSPWMVAVHSQRKKDKWVSTCTVIWNRQLHIPYLYVNINTADHASTATKIREASISCIHSCLSFKMTWVGIVYNCEVHTKALSSVRPFYQTEHALHYTCDHARLMSCTHPVVSCSTLRGISLAWDEASFQEGFEKRCMTTSVAPCCTYFCYPSISKVRSLSKNYDSFRADCISLEGPEPPRASRIRTLIDTQRGFAIRSILGAHGGIPLPVINIHKAKFINMK